MNVSIVSSPCPMASNVGTNGTSASATTTSSP